MAVILPELYPLIMSHLPSETVKRCSLINHALHELARPIIFSSVSLSRHPQNLPSQLAFFNSMNGVQMTRYIRELHLNLFSLVRTLASYQKEFETFFGNIVPNLRVLDIDGTQNWGYMSMDYSSSKNFLVDLIPRAVSLVSLRIKQSCLLSLGEIMILCPCVRFLDLVDPDDALLQPSAQLKRHAPASDLTPKLHSLNLTKTQPQSSNDLTILHLILRSINSVALGVSSQIKVLSFHGFHWLKKEPTTLFVQEFLSPKSLLDGLHEIHFPQVVYQSINDSSLLLSLSNLPKLKIIVFNIGPMTKSVSRNWPIFFTWIREVLSEPHSLEKLVFEVPLVAYVPVIDPMMIMNVLDGKGDAIPELTFIVAMTGLVMTGMEWKEEERVTAFTGWLNHEFPTIKTLGRLSIIHQWKK
ncbi:hypothetical protein DL96DRAFT_1607707 [Flagelloscypha sp. PMI_526]|nr:hypothetical protein DL96DRAFT_1607707 [Flagelloscypha sp. PMI_526]